MTLNHDRDVERLVRDAGARRIPDAVRADRVKAAAQQAWRTEVRARRARRWYWAGGLVAAAAAILLVVRPWSVGRVLPIPSVAPPAEVVGNFSAVAADVTLPGDARAAAAPGFDVRAAGVVETGASATATIRLHGGGELRLAGGTRVALISNRTIRLDRGAIYLDSQGATPGSFAVETAAGLVRDIGTRFEVRVTSVTGTRVRVRDGAVQLERGPVIDRAGAGTELSVAEGRVETRRFSPADPAWSWTTLAAPGFVVEGATLDAFLTWAEHEGGFVIDRSALTGPARATVLHGSIAGMAIADALANVLPTCGLTARIAGERVTIRVAQ